jgi:hypothetical protein
MDSKARGMAISRFWSKVKKSRGCWIWTGARNSKRTKSGVLQSNRYGRMIVAKRSIYAHRFSYEINIGAIPKDACVLHKCDEMGCVNPRHLRLGSITDNNRDMWRKGRGKSNLPKVLAAWV